MPPKAPKKEEKGPDGEDADPTEKQVLEAQRDARMAEIAFRKDRVRKLKEENARLKLECEELVKRLDHATGDATKVLDFRQTDIEKKEDQITRLESECAKLERDLRNKQLIIEALQEQCAKNKAKLEEARKVKEEKKILEDRQRDVENRTHKHRDFIEKLDAEIEELERQLSAANAYIQELEIQSSSRTELKIIFGEAWQVAVNNFRLKGALPHDREFNTLVCFGGQNLILYGGTPWEEGRDMSILNLDTKVWEDPTSGPSSAAIAGLTGDGRKDALALPRAGHCSIAIRPSQMLVFGGKEPDSGGDVDGHFVPGISVLDYENLRWEEPGTRGTPPAPRVSHCACVDRDSHLYIFGGRAETAKGESELKNDLWCLTYAGATETWSWQQITASGAPPSPRWGATICVSNDGRRLYIMGGHDDTQSLGDVHCLNLDRSLWQNIGPGVGTPPRARHCHTASMVGNYMIISGGTHQPSPASVDPTPRRCTDTWVMDLETQAWEQLHEWAAMGKMLNHAAYAAVYEKRIYTLKPSTEKPNSLCELEILELARPEDIEGLKQRARQETDIVAHLEILDDAEVTSNAVLLSWRAPSKNADRISCYKLKLATPTGVVKEVYRGRATSYKVGGLRGNSEYIFCIKAEYDDGWFLWSEPKSFTTRT